MEAKGTIQDIMEERNLEIMEARDTTLETMEVKDTTLEIMEAKGTIQDIMEAKVTRINQIWCHPPVSLTQEVRNATLGTTEVKDTTLETMEAKDTTLEIMEAKVTIQDIMEVKVTHINQIWCHPPVSPTQEVRDATSGTMEAKDITLETMVDRDTIQGDTIQGDTTLVAEMVTRSISLAMALVDEASSDEGQAKPSFQAVGTLGGPQLSVKAQGAPQGVQTLPGFPARLPARRPYVPGQDKRPLLRGQQEVFVQEPGAPGEPWDGTTVALLLQPKDFNPAIQAGSVQTLPSPIQFVETPQFRKLRPSPVQAQFNPQIQSGLAQTLPSPIQFAEAQL